MIVRNTRGSVRGKLLLLYIAMVLVAILDVSNSVGQEAPTPPALTPPEPSPRPLLPQPPLRERLLAPVPSQFQWIKRDVRPNLLLEGLLAGQMPSRLFMSVSLSEMYSDNFDQESENQREEFETAITLGTSLQLQNARGFVSLANTLSANHEHREEITNVGFVNLSLNMGYNLRRLSLALSDTLVIDDDPEQASTAGIRRERSRFLRHGVTPQIRYALDRLTSVELAYANIVVLQEDEDDEDSITHEVTGSLNRRFTRHLEGSLSYTFSYENVDNREPSQVHLVASTVGFALTRTMTLTVETSWAFTDRGGSESDTALYGGNVGIRYRATPTFALVVGAGAMVFDDAFDDPRLLSTWQLGFDGSLAFLPSTTLSLLLTQSLADTGGEVEDVGIVLTQSLGIRIDQILLPPLRLALFATFTQTDFLEGVNTDIAARNDEELFISAGARLSYTLTRTWSLSLEYQQQRRDTNTQEDEFVENRVTVTLSNRFPVF